MLVYILASMLHSFDWTLPNGEWKRISEKRTKTKPEQQNRARERKEREKVKKSTKVNPDKVKVKDGAETE
ncbi:hypothetical protein Tco_0177871 [Tanacetum coccineum]